MTDKWRQLGHEIGFGIGIAHGYATLGTISFEGRFDYAAIGTVANVASQLCDEAKPGQILISPRVLIAVKGAVTIEPVGEFELKGIRRPIAAYNVLAHLTVNVQLGDWRASQITAPPFVSCWPLSSLSGLIISASIGGITDMPSGCSEMWRMTLACVNYTASTQTVWKTKSDLVIALSGGRRSFCIFLLRRVFTRSGPTADMQDLALQTRLSYLGSEIPKLHLQGKSMLHRGLDQLTERKS